MSYRSEALSLPDQGGLEITFTVFDRTRDLRALSLGSGSQITLQAGEGSLGVMELLQIVNSSQLLVDAEAGGLVLRFPDHSGLLSPCCMSSRCSCCRITPLWSKARTWTSRGTSPRASRSSEVMRPSEPGDWNK